MSSDPTPSEGVLAGVIAAEQDPPGLDPRAFDALLAAVDGLEPIAGERAAKILVNGEVRGRLVWSKSRANEIDVFGDVDAVGDVAWNVAAALGGRFVTLAELTSC